jgi:hypothetical protein
MSPQFLVVGITQNTWANPPIKKRIPELFNECTIDKCIIPAIAVHIDAAIAIICIIFTYSLTLTVYKNMHTYNITLM